MKVCSVCDRCFEDCVVKCDDPAHGELSVAPNSIDMVPGYLIERVITSSPNVVTYQAQQIEYRHDCVISIADSHSEQFLSDAEAAATLFNAGVAGVVESGTLSNGSSFAVFEAFAGESLRDMLQRNDLSLLDQIRIARQTAEAVHAIHSVGLVHGALRPENISVEDLSTDEMAVKVHNIDLGSEFAKGLLTSRFSMDSALDVLRYFAPERFRGEPATEHSDVYSLGILLYEILSGHPPFEAASAGALADMHLHQKPPEIKIENFDLRMLLTHTISEGLQKQSSFRQSTADLFARQMRHIEQLATHVSTPPPAVVAAVASARPHRQVLPERSFTSIQPVASMVVPQPLPVASKTKTTTLEIAETAEVPTNSTLSEPVEHTIPLEDPTPFVTPPTKRSRLKGVKKRLQSHLADLKASSAPTLIEWQQPDGDIPSIDAVRAEMTNLSEPLAFAADEEITHVRPKMDRIEVDWDEPDDVERRPFALAFLPTLLSRRNAAEADDLEKSDPGFAALQPTGRDLGKLPIYAVALCAFLVVGFGIFRIGSALAEDNGGYIGEARPAPIHISAPVVQPEAIKPQLTVMNIPAREINLPAAVSTAEVRSVDLKPKEVSQPKPVLIDSPKQAKPEPAKIASVPIAKPSKTESPIVPSTLVITRGKGEPRSVIVAKTPATRTTNAGSGATRPRIVSLPD